MPRWTSDIDEVRRISQLPEFIKTYGFKNCRIVLTDGATTFEGQILPARTGNNAGAGGQWMYFGTIVVRTPDKDIEVDFLDVDRAEAI